MDRQRAIKLLDDTFNSNFNVNRFAVFVKELFNNFNVNVKNWSVWKEYRDYIESYQRLGSYKDDSKKIVDVLVVKLKKSSSMDRARTMQRNFIAKYLSNADKDSALVAFYGDDPQDWRFSFVKMEYNRIRDETGKVKNVKELTPAKRYSFLVGVNEPNHTCGSQFLKLIMEEEINPSLLEIETAFSIDNVTKEFFNEYKELFLELEESLQKVISKDKHVKEEFENKSISSVDFAKKLLGQIVFIYFLQKKGWLGVIKDKEGKFKKWGTGSKKFLRTLFDKDIVPYDNFFNDILEPLFYEALNNDRSQDNDYYSRFECKIPFLNGGLFEPLNDYDWSGTEIVLDNNIFDRILSTFDKFNFTVKEDEPLEKEVAVDPEMLGKVFENLLTVKDRKSKGAFYTPREIVHYMCQQSLINYLETNTSIERKDIEKFIQLGDLAMSNDYRIITEIDSKNEKLKKGMISAETFEKEINELLEEFNLPKSIVDNREDIDYLLKEIKIVDPAVGSGAFPVGMLNEIVKARSVLTIFYDKNKQRERNDYNLKREIIENCIYGVDIESSAVDITKLRFWLSLIVDELDMQNIKPLPNLDHKIMCGNSLLEEFEGIKLFDEKLLGEVKKDVSFEVKAIEKDIAKLYKKKGDIVRGKSNGESIKNVEKEIKKLEKKKIKLLSASKDTSRDLTLDEATQHRIKESQRKLTELKKLQKQFFNEQNRKIKKQLRTDIDKIEWELIEETLKEQGNEDAMQKLEQYKKNKSKPFFLWKLYFAEVFQRENPGFDVVIANPPYVSAWAMEKQDPTMRTQIKHCFKGYDFLLGHWDLYISFVALGHSILKRDGSLGYIVPNPILREKYAEATRIFLLNKNYLQSILEFNDVNVFEQVARRTTVFILKKSILEQYPVIIISNNKGTIIISNTTTKQEWLNNHKSQFLIKSNLKESSLLIKIESRSKKVGNYFYVNYGAQVSSKIKGGFRKKDVVNTKPTGNAKLFVEGKDVHRWKLSYRKLWLDYCSDKMYGPRSPSLFESPKLIIRKISDKKHKIAATYDETEKYTDDGNVLIVSYNDVANSGTMTSFSGYEKINRDISLKYVLSILLSEISVFYFRKKFATESLQGSTSHTYPASVRGMILKEISPEQQKPFINLVNQILSVTKADDYLDNPDKQVKVKRLEKEIDQLVYKLYELTSEEIKIVEEFNNG